MTKNLDDLPITDCASCEVLIKTIKRLHEEVGDLKERLYDKDNELENLYFERDQE